MFEPFFDQYLATVVFNGGVPVYVPLHPDRSKAKPTGEDWKIDFDELRYVHDQLIGTVQPCNKSSLAARRSVLRPR